MQMTQHFTDAEEVPRAETTVWHEAEDIGMTIPGQDGSWDFAAVSTPARVLPDPIPDKLDYFSQPLATGVTLLTDVEYQAAVDAKTQQEEAAMAQWKSDADAATAAKAVAREAAIAKLKELGLTDEMVDALVGA